MLDKKSKNPALSSVAIALCASVNNYNLVSKLTGISPSTLRYRNNKFKRWLTSAILQTAQDELKTIDNHDQLDEFIEIQMLNLDTQKRILQALERGESLGELAPKDAANVLKILHELSLSHKSALTSPDKKTNSKAGRTEQFDKWSQIWKELTNQSQ